MYQLYKFLEASQVIISFVVISFVLAIVGIVVPACNIASQAKAITSLICFVLCLIFNISIVIGMLSKRNNWSDPLRHIKLTYLNQQVQVVRQHQADISKSQSNLAVAV
ncbi:Hypothetical_protein [Hexamita inflata]|uniref:Hypothetical_protein n=1 Tax=Hexamita inflata TaxID=28002 RepID=A0AA86NZI7_9EUKA|nr:Hypothetical protein HINF_LOCUS15371 [Hexamita inflata]CAI9941162.1 Hypothetical protein HINF_LOCUS28807 [Hexamita inflata]